MGEKGGVGILDCTQDSVAGEETEALGMIVGGEELPELENMFKNGEIAAMGSEPRLGSIGKLSTAVAMEEELSFKFVLLMVVLFESSLLFGRGFGGVRIGNELSNEGWRKLLDMLYKLEKAPLGSGK
ncbi:hypothetical protein O181_097437 [Austropuccinia psidii MF-1]|uniref:Uncharacterized protein n=1 Tax=Austropuccinia psidii MF-1 TaxID=1389203 RepID=A0A9Q3PEI5_9BASI|nr:hypothetical protein [Austropuccinia psidii MF-1]